MTVRRRVKRIGGSLGILIPRDFAEATDVTDDSEVRLTLVGRQSSLSPYGTSWTTTRSAAFGAVLRGHS